MPDTEPQSENSITRLIISVFRLNGALVAAGNDLLGDLDLSTARWQVLGTAVTAANPLSVAGIARDMGLARQGVRVIVNNLVADGLLKLEADPKDRRAPLVLPTERGTTMHAAAMERQQPWAAGLATGLSVERIADATELLELLLHRIEKERS